MTKRAGRPRLRGAMKPYAHLLIDAIGEGSVIDFARAWGVPRWVLDDGISEKVNAPSAKYLTAVARGLDMTADELLDKVAPQEAVT